MPKRNFKEQEQLEEESEHSESSFVDLSDTQYSDFGSESFQSADEIEEEEENLAEKYLAPSDSENDDFVSFINYLFKPDNPDYTTIGKVPDAWYDDLPHIGYDIDGKKVWKPVTKDELDKFLDQMEDPDYWTSFQDAEYHQKVKLTAEEIDQIKRLQGNTYPDEIDPYPRFEDFFTQDVEQMPLTGAPEPKSRFIPSKWEHKRVMKMVRAIRSGKILIKKQKKAERQPVYDLWANATEEERAVNFQHIPAPKLSLPGHEESYRPPEEYLFSKEEEQEWLEKEEEDRPLKPQSFPNLRTVPSYPKFIKERFSRCLDLYLCPRALRKPKVSLEQILPELPDPKDLEPYPKYLSMTYRGHSDKIRSFSFNHDGQWMVSGSDDKTVRIWEVMTGKCVKIIQLDSEVESVAWNPNKSLSIILIGCSTQLYLLCPKVESQVSELAALTILKEVPDYDEEYTGPKWEKTSPELQKQGILLFIPHSHDISQVQWHKKGDFFASVCPKGGSMAVQIHQLSKKQSQMPFSKQQSHICSVLFHPSKPLFAVASQKFIRIYNLIKQELYKKLQPGVQWISSIDFHPNGDHLLVSSFDKKVCWFDLDLSTTPYKTLQTTSQAVRKATYHSKQPLFASCGDDGSVHLFHGMVYNDLMQNPLIVPVKILKAHEKVGGIGVLCCAFHPQQPWVMSSGADGLLKLFT